MTEDHDWYANYRREVEKAYENQRLTWRVTLIAGRTYQITWRGENFYSAEIREVFP